MTRLRRLIATSACGLALVALGAAPTLAVDIIREHGACSLGPSNWRVVTRQYDASTLLVRAEVSNSSPGQEWFMVVTDNGEKVIRSVKFANDNGFVRWVRKTPDRPGADLIEMAANNRDSSEICSGSLNFPQN